MLNPSRVKKLILVPALVTLAVTLVRLAGELMGGPAILFGTDAGGGGSLIGISWLIPIFGIYFGWKLPQEGLEPKSRAKAIGFPFLSLLLAIVLAVINFTVLEPGSIPSLIIFSLVCLVVMVVVKLGWDELFWVLTGYAVAARVPVAIVMLLAINGGWGTHYDAPPPDFPEMGVLSEWFITGLVPQLGFWIGFTVIIGAIFSGLTMAVSHRQK